MWLLRSGRSIVSRPQKECSALLRGFESRIRDCEPNTRIFVYNAESLTRSTIRKNIWADNQTIEIDKKEGAVKLVFTTSQWIPVLRWVLS